MNLLGTDWFCERLAEGLYTKVTVVNASLYVGPKLTEKKQINKMAYGNSFPRKQTNGMTSESIHSF